MDREKIKARLIFWYTILWILFIIAIYLSYGVYFVDTVSTKSKWVILFSSAISILLGACKFLEVSFYKYKDEEIKKSVNHENKLNLIFFGYKTLILLLFCGLVFGFMYKYIYLKFALCSAVGMLLFVLASNIAAIINTNGHYKENDAILSSLNSSLKLKFNTYSAISFLYAGIIFSGVVILYHIFKDYDMIIGYTLGFSIAAFCENVIFALSDSAIKNTEFFIKKYENAKEGSNPLVTFKNILSNYNFSKFFEIYLIALVLAIATGANTTGLMGAFLPFIIVANSMFISAIAVLFSKVNKMNHVSKLLKITICVAVITSLMSYFEVRYWLGPDFIPIAISATLGAFSGVVSLFVNKEKSTNNELQKIKQYLFNAIYGIAVLILVYLLSFMFSEGINYVLFGFYNIAIAILSFNSIILITCIVNCNSNFKAPVEGYIKISDILLVFSSFIAFILVKELEEVDLVNPFIMLSVLIGAVIPYILLYISSCKIMKQTRSLILFCKKQIKTGELHYKTMIFKNVRQSLSCAILLLIILVSAMYALKRFPGIETLLSFSVGVVVSSFAILFKNDKTASSLIGALLRFVSILLLSVTILFI